MSASLFGLGQTLAVNVNGTVVTEHFVGLGGQTLFTLANFVYAQNTNSIIVFINGQKQTSGKDYTETSTSTFTLVEGVVAGDTVDVIGFPEMDLQAVTAGAVNIGAGYSLQNYINDDAINVKAYPYLADGTGVTDSTANINAALAVGALGNLRVSFGSARDTYKISGALFGNSGARLFGGGAKINQTAIRTEILNFEGKNNVEIQGLVFQGLGTDFNNSDSNRAVGVMFSGGESNIWVHHNTFLNLSYTSVRFKGTSKFKFTENIVVGPGASVLNDIGDGANYGILADVGCVDGLIFGNSLSYCAQGYRVEQSTGIKVLANDITDIVTQHGGYAGSGLIDFTCIGNRAARCALIGFKVQQFDAVGFDSVGINVSDNRAIDCGDQGFLIYNASSPAPTYKLRDVTCENNLALNCTGNGFYFTSIYGGSVNDNKARNCNQSGMVWGECDGLEIHDNTVDTCQLSGMRDLLPSVNVTLKDNSIRNAAQSVAPGDRYSMFLNYIDKYVIEGNKFSDTNAKVETGLYIVDGVLDTCRLENNTNYNATLYGARFPSPAQTFLSERNNNWFGTSLATSNNTKVPTIASVAGALTIPQNQPIIHISGTNTMTSIASNGHTGNVVMFILDAASTFTDGSNLRLAGSITGPGVFFLGCDGTDWWQGSAKVIT